MSREVSLFGAIRIVYASDGESIATYIKELLTHFGIGLEVIIEEIGIAVNANASCFNGILLTPDMKDELTCSDKQKKECLISSSVNAILSHDESVNLKDEDIRNCLSLWFPTFSPWKIIHISKEKDGYKRALVNILEAVKTPTNPPPSLVQFKLMPKKIWTEKDDVIISFKKEMKNCKVTAKIKAGMNWTTVTATELNPYTYTLRPSGFCQGKTKIEVFVNDETYGIANLETHDKMDILYALLYNISNPLEFLCQALGVEFADHSSLDRELADILNNGDVSNIMAGFHNLDLKAATTVEKSKKEMPTLLHFGATYGLTSFCQVLLTLPGSKTAKHMMNKNGETPSKIALTKGYIELAALLKDIDEIEETKVSLISEQDEINVDSDLDDVFNKNEGYMVMNDKEENNTDVYARVRSIRGLRQRSCGPPLPPRDRKGFSASELSQTTKETTETEVVRKRRESDRYKLHRTGHLWDSGNFSGSDGSDFSMGGLGSFEVRRSHCISRIWDDTTINFSSQAVKYLRKTTM